MPFFPRSSFSLQAGLQALTQLIDRFIRGQGGHGEPCSASNCGLTITIGQDTDRRYKWFLDPRFRLACLSFPIRLKWVGEIGFFSVLHNWSRKLEVHPHVHCVVAAGGLSPDHTRWLASHPLD